MPAGPKNSERVFIDTSFVLATFNTKDVNHAWALELSEEYEQVPTLTTDAVLLEIGNGLARGFRVEAAITIHHLLTSPESEVVRINPVWFDRAFHLYETHADKSWGLVDCFSFAVMRERGLQRALTSDQHFVQAGFQALMR